MLTDAIVEVDTLPFEALVGQLNHHLSGSTIETPTVLVVDVEVDNIDDYKGMPKEHLVEGKVLGMTLAACVDVDMPYNCTLMSDQHY